MFRQTTGTAAVALGALMVIGALHAEASPVLVGANNDGNGGFLVGNQVGQQDGPPPFLSYANLGWGQQFSLTQAVIADQLTVFVDAGPTANGTFTVQLTNLIGPGAGAGNVLFSAMGNFGPHPTPGGHVAVDFLLPNLALGAGTYYVVMTSSTEVTYSTNHPDYDPADDPSCTILPGELCMHVGGWANGGSIVNTFGTVGTATIGITIGAGGAPAPPALHELNGANPDHANFLLYGNPQADPIPEPATLSLLGLGLAGAAVRIRKSGRR